MYCFITCFCQFVMRSGRFHCNKWAYYNGLFLVCHWVLLWNEVSGCLWDVTLLNHSSLTTATLLLDIYVAVHVCFFPWYAKPWWRSFLLSMFRIIYYVKFLKASRWVEGTVCSKTLDSHSPVRSPDRWSCLPASCVWVRFSSDFITAGHHQWKLLVFSLF